MNTEKKYTKEQILKFKESDWEFRRSSGYSGYDNVKHQNNEQNWIYASEYEERQSLKKEYNNLFSIFVEFQSYQMKSSPEQGIPASEIENFLDFKFFKK